MKPTVKITRHRDRRINVPDYLFGLDHKVIGKRDLARDNWYYFIHNKYADFSLTCHYLKRCETKSLWIGDILIIQVVDVVGMNKSSNEIAKSYMDLIVRGNMSINDAHAFMEL